MEEISRHISELLFDHDCVIVPSLGGFLASNQSTRILLPKHIIYPPYRHIAFNIFLKHNDGLLANHLSESRNINYHEAIQLIEKFVSTCFDQLEQGKKFILSEIGTLYYDKERNLQFEPFRNFNHMKESFGMEPINFMPVQRGENDKNEVIVERIFRPSVAADKPKFRQTLARNTAYVGALVVGAVMCWFAINLYLIGPKNYESTSLNPFDSQGTSSTIVDSVDNKNLTFDKNNTPDSNIIAVPSVDTSSVAINSTKPVSPPENNVVIPETKKELPVQQEQPPARINTMGKNHFVVAGVFKIRENAEKMVGYLKDLGFSNAQIIEFNRRSYVAYENGTSRQSAEAMIDTLKRKNLDSWIWKY